MPKNLSFHELNHLNRLLQQQGSIKYIYNEFTRNISSHLTKWTEYPSGDLWSRNTKVEEAINNEINSLRNKLTINIENYTKDAWNRSNLKSDELVKGYIENLAVSDIVKKGMFIRNEEVFNKFMQRKVDGITLSKRVWNIANGTKENIEFYLQSGLSTGRSAAKISQDVRQLLNEPDRRFRRIREGGRLVMSQPMKDYHPGRGIYRSSYKNALRLAATNTNEMYRMTDNDRWNKLEFVLGYRVQRSANNFGACVVCDSMVGEYPKNFLFIGWHPQCICIATPILMNEDEFIKRLVDDDFSNVKQIEDIPESSRKYLEKQLEKENVNLNSYLFKNNKQYFRL